MYALDGAAGFYIFQIFSFMYPGLIEKEKAYSSFSYLSLIVALGALPVIHYVWRWLLILTSASIQDFFRRFTKREIVLSVGLSVVFMGILLITSAQTSVWVAPLNLDFFVSGDAMNPDNICCDVVFGSDCMYYTTLSEVFRVNTFRHPYYSVILFPFFPIYFLLTFLFWLLGFGAWYYSAGMAMATLQIAWWIFTGVMLRRLLLAIVNESCSYAMMIFYLTSFPMIFIFTPERLAFSVFALLMFLYIRRFSGNSDRSSLSKLDYLVAFVAGGATLPSVLFPFFSLWQNRTSVKKCTWECCKFGIAWLVVAGIWNTVFLPLPKDAHYSRFYECFRWMPLTQSWWEPCVERSNSLESTTSSQNKKAVILKTTSLSLREYHQVRQFLHFMEANIYTPEYRITAHGVGNAPASEIKNVSLGVGIVVSVLCVVSILLYRKNFFVQDMGIWFLFSVGILGILGFGSVSNELSLFVPYFSWAIFPLTVLPIYRFWGDKYHQTTAILLVFAVISFASQLQLIWRVTTETDFSAPQTSVEEIQEQVSDLNFLNFS